MQIPSVLEKKILRGFGPKGEAWLSSLPYLLEQCVEKWKLSNLHNSPVMSYNLVVFADCPDYGRVALKIGVPHRELFTEIQALRLYQGRNICKCYDADLNLGALLLQRFTPGLDLTTVNDRMRRIHIAADLVSRLPIPLEQSTLPRLSDLAQQTFSRLKIEHPREKEMHSLVDIAQGMITELEAIRPLGLLHGDLNHWNILLDGGDWKAIDPKGQYGVATMEGARFMLNELEMEPKGDWWDCLSDMVEIFSQRLKEEPAIVAQCAFIDKAISTSWKFEEHIIKDRSEDVDECARFLEFYKGFV